MIDRAKFFASVRAAPFGGAMTQDQVEGCGEILTEWEKRKLTDLRQLAYMLATCFWETARTMQAIHEHGQVSYFDKYNAGTRLGIALGNNQAGDGYRFRGRGYVQLTGRSNYRAMSDLLGVDFVTAPDLALTHAAPIMFEGMIRGMFTGKALKDYFGAGVTDWQNARRIINGLDKSSEIADIARKFHSAIVAAQMAAGMASRKPDIRPPVKKDSPAKPSGWLAALLSIFKRKAP